MKCISFKNKFQTFNLVIISVRQEDGWIIIQRRVDASVSFERSWDEYVAGFGDVDGNFWLGLDTIHDLTTAQLMRLQIDVVPVSIPAVSIPYPYFHVGDAASGYVLTITSNTPGHDTLCNSLNYQTGSKFSTSDCDNDIYSGHCAVSHRAGWWFSDCYKLNLNGVYGSTMRMHYLSGTIRAVTMKIRAIN